MTPLRVLVVNHTARVSGAEHSLLDLLGALPSDVEVVAACPDGPLAQRLRDQGVAVGPIPATDLSFRLHPRHTPVGMLAMARAAVTVARIARRERVDVVHANTVRAGLIAAAAARFGTPRPVVHVRDVLPASRTGRVVRAVVNRGAAALVANSRFTAAAWGPTSLPVTVALGPVDLCRFDPARHGRDQARRALGLDDAPVLLVGAQLTPWKGQDLAIEVTAALRDHHPAVTLLLAGDVEFDAAGTGQDNRAYAASLHHLARIRGISDRVRFLGRRDDMPALLAAADVALVPSWQEPMGRSVLEAMAMGVPVVATDAGGPAELVGDARAVVLVPPRRPDRWVAAVEGVLADGDRTGPRVRASLRAAAARHDVGEHARSVVGAWRNVCPPTPA
jgi:glycosyltransferase involved in cell wall biosynthesis